MGSQKTLSLVRAGMVTLGGGLVFTVLMLLIRATPLTLPLIVVLSGVAFSSGLFLRSNDPANPNPPLRDMLMAAVIAAVGIGIGFIVGYFLTTFLYGLGAAGVGTRMPITDADMFNVLPFVVVASAIAAVVATLFRFTITPGNAPVFAGVVALAGAALAGMFWIASAAVPLPLILFVTGLGFAFAAGLIMRVYHHDDRPKRRGGMLIAGLIGLVGPGLGLLLSIAAAPLFVNRTFNPADVNMLLVLVVVGGGVIGMFASVASIPWLFMAVPLTIYLTWIIGPMIATVFISFTNWEGLFGAADRTRIVGMENYTRLFDDKNFWQAFSNNIRWLLFFIVIPTSMGLALAMIFNGKFFGNRFFKVAFFIPLIVAPSVVAVIWVSMYRPADGLINSFLRIFAGPEAKLPGWLADQGLVLWCIIFAAAWRQVGYVMVLYLAGLKSLDTSLIEAATVDGARPWERFRYVIFPLLGPVTVVVVVISVIDSLRAFDLVAIMTRGGPAYSSEVMANFMYMRAFNDYDMGYAGAVAVVLLLLMLVFIVPYLARQVRTELEY